MQIIDRVFNASSRSHYLILTLVGALFFLPFIGNIHLFDWDEINFAEMSREMRVTGEYFKVQIDYQPFYEKPPLFAWIQNLSFSIWGVNELGARFPNAIVGIACLLLLYSIGSRIKGPKFGLLWSLCYSCGLLPFFFFKTGLIDPLFNIFIFSSVAYLASLIQSEKKRSYQFFVAGIINGIAILAKGPVALLILLLTVSSYWLLFRRKTRLVTIKQIIFFGLGILLMAGIWFGPETVMRGPKFIQEFVTYMIGLLSKDVASHGQPFYYHFVVVFLGCFPLSVFGLKNLVKTNATELWDFNRWMICLFWVVLILFSLVKTKIINYSSLTYYPLSYLAAYTLYQYHEKGKFAQSWFFLIMGTVLCLPIVVAPVLFQNEALIASLFEKDRFSRESIGQLVLPAYTVYVGAIWLVGIFIAFFLIGRRQILKGVFIYALSIGLFMNSALYSILPPVEQAVQGASIQYFQSLEGKDVYLGTVGFKSYGKYFYSKRPQELSGYSGQELLEGMTDKDTYLVVKPRRLKRLEQYPEFELIDSKGGFYLFKRKAQVNAN